MLRSSLRKGLPERPVIADALPLGRAHACISLLGGGDPPT
jgi:hypothetical protein